jgi:hypothetical protein
MGLRPVSFVPCTLMRTMGHPKNRCWIQAPAPKMSSAHLCWVSAARLKSGLIQSARIPTEKPSPSEKTD